MGDEILDGGVPIETEPPLTLGELAGCDFSFDVTEEAIPPFDEIVPVAPYRKAYARDEDLKAEDDDRALFVARASGNVCGYILITRAWNRYGLIEDFAVDRLSRGQGIGRQLMDAAVSWARAHDLPGIRLETQSNNVSACRFYERYGFRLGGYDRHLYDALSLPQKETALFWYLFFQEGGTPS